MIPSDKQKRDFFKTLRRKNAAVNIQRFLAAGVSLEERDSAGRTPLIIAARYGDLELVNTLLAAGAKIDARDHEGNTPLVHALTYNVVNPEVVRRLLQAGADVHDTFSPDFYGMNLLTICAQHGYTEILHLLLEAGAGYLGFPDSAYGRVRQALPSALRRVLPDGGFRLLRCAAAHPDTFAALQDAGADIRRGDTSLLLLECIESYNWASADRLLQQGISLRPSLLDKADSDGRTPLNRALGCHAEASVAERTVSYLLQHGATPNTADDQGYTPLTMAIFRQHSLGVIRLLLEAGASANVLTKYGDTPLTYAIVYNRSPELVQTLLQAGADPNMSCRRMPLHSALVGGEEEIAQMLLTAGADLQRTLTPEVMTHLKADTPLSVPTTLLFHILHAIPTLRHIRLVLEAGADVNAADADGTTPLMLACRSASDPAIIRLLLEAGADIFARDSKGDTPYDYARRSDHAEQHLALLREYEHKLYPTDTP